MTLGDLAFLLAALVTLGGLVSVLWRLLRRDRRTALRIAGAWSIGASGYLAVLLLVSLRQPGRTIPFGAAECFDDWCIAVESVQERSLWNVTGGANRRFEIWLRVSNRGRGRPQAEPDAYVYLRGATGGTVNDVARDEDEMLMLSPGLGDVIPAGESRLVRAVFVVPPRITAPVLVKARRSAFPAPFIVGDPASPLHRPTVHALHVAPAA